MALRSAFNWWLQSVQESKHDFFLRFVIKVLIEVTNNRNDRDNFSNYSNHGCVSPPNHRIQYLGNLFGVVFAAVYGFTPIECLIGSDPFLVTRYEKANHRR